MALQFHRVLAGVGVGRGEVEAHAIVEQLAFMGELGMQGMARRQGLADDGLADLERQWAGDAHDAHPALAGWRGDRRYGVRVAQG